MALNAGTIIGTNIANTDNSTSMAEVMEQVFRKALPSVVPGADPTKGEAERQLLFVAVAQGVVRHLQEHHNDFKVEVDLPGSLGTAQGEVTEIK